MQILQYAALTSFWCTKYYAGHYERFGWPFDYTRHTGHVNRPAKLKKDKNHLCSQNHVLKAFTSLAAYKVCCNDANTLFEENSFVFKISKSKIRCIALRREEMNFKQVFKTLYLDHTCAWSDDSLKG
uniref:Uncharacterized protein n=1 Tax=Romanomermis culicivorax TaxID=13658 RepID=A0A915J4H3_ROMCU